MEKTNCKELLENNITKDYKKADDALPDATKKDKEIAAKTDIDDRVCVTSKRESFITLTTSKIT